MKENKRFYVTTPIYYLSGEPTLGTCCTTVYADALARWHRLRGDDVLFLTGSDEHGQKVEEKSLAKGKTPKEFVDELDKVFKDLWKKLGISYDKYIRTTDDYHEEAVQKIFTKLYEQGDIYKNEYEGLYCVPCEAFFTETQAKDGLCPDCGRPVTKAKEEAYFFRASKYTEKLKEYYENHPEFVRLDSTRKEMLTGFINQGIQDVCVSRTTVNWGIKVPFDPKHTIYVWIDALPNYLTALGYMQEDDSLFKKYWPCNVHLMAKEIARFHLVIWPCILMALGLDLPKQIHAHGWLTKAGVKFGKSLGNGFNPNFLADNYGVDAVRYFLIKNGPIMGDAPYDNETFIKTINSDLCNTLGNLLSRTTAMINQSFDSLPKLNRAETLLDKELIDSVVAMPEKIDAYIETLDINDAINEILQVARNANKYIDETAPWTLKENKEELANILHNIYFALYGISVCLKAFLPETSEKFLNSLGICDGGLDSITREFNQSLGGNIVTKIQPFNRYDVQKEVEFLEVTSVKKEEKVEKVEKKEQKQQKKEEKMEENKTEELTDENNEITFEDFCKVKLVTGKILECSKVEKADKLLCSKVEIGNEVRTIVSGIREYYTPEEMVGKMVVIVENLKPRKIRGIESKGMILCVEHEGKLCVIKPEDDTMPSGLEVE